MAKLSEINHGLYRTTLQPLVRAVANEQSAEWLRRTHPARMIYEFFSDQNPLMRPLPSAAEWVADHRQPVAADNIFLQWQTIFSDCMVQGLNTFRDWRDTMMEQTFFGMYSQPWFQAFLGLKASDETPRTNPGAEPDHLALVELQKEALIAKMDQGGPREALLRGLVYIRLAEGAVDERGFAMIRRLREKHEPNLTLSEFKEAIREQFFMVLLDDRRALETIPHMLEGHQDKGPELFARIETIATAAGALGDEAQQRLKKIEKLFIPQKKAAAKKTSAKKKPLKA